MSVLAICLLVVGFFVNGYGWRVRERGRVLVGSGVAFLGSLIFFAGAVSLAMACA